MSGGSGAHNTQWVLQPCPKPKKFKEYRFEGVPNYLFARGAPMSQVGPVLNVVQNVKFTLVKATKAQRASKRTALLFL